MNFENKLLSFFYGCFLMKKQLTMIFSVPGRDSSEINKLVNDMKAAREESKNRGFLSPFEVNVWSHISPRFEGCYLRLRELCAITSQRPPSDREQNEIEMLIADLEDLCSIGINLERFVLLMDELQKAVYIYEKADPSTYESLCKSKSRNLESFCRRVNLFKQIVEQFEYQDKGSFTLVPFSVDNNPVDLNHLIDCLEDHDDLAMVFIDLAYNYDTMPETPFSEREFFRED